MKIRDILTFSTLAVITTGSVLYEYINTKYAEDATKEASRQEQLAIEIGKRIEAQEEFMLEMADEFNSAIKEVKEIEAKLEACKNQ